MSAPRGRRLLPVLLLLALLPLPASCGRTSSAPDDGQAPPESGNGGSGATSSHTNQGGITLGGSVGTTDAGDAPASSARAGGPLVDPTLPSRPCGPDELPGQPCEDLRCWGTRCGVHFNLACVAGTWAVDYPALAWELVCPTGNESIYDLGEIDIGACCGDLRPRNDVDTQPPSCEHCPEAAPQDGDACRLLDDCMPQLIDCFYDCCCYGNMTWAQCDGERWHVATNCSGK
jgi:hypothetical protein